MNVENLFKELEICNLAIDLLTSVGHCKSDYYDYLVERKDYILRLIDFIISNDVANHQSAN